MTPQQGKKFSDLYTKWGESTCGRSIEAFMFEELEDENERLRTTLVAGAEFIKENWSKLCDEEGYGPQNLLLRMDGTLNTSGYPGYSAGNFAKQDAEIESLRKQLEQATETSRLLRSVNIKYEASIKELEEEKSKRDTLVESYKQQIISRRL